MTALATGSMALVIRWRFDDFSAAIGLVSRETVEQPCATGAN